MAEQPDAQNRKPFSVGAAFGAAAQWTSRQCGHPATFVLACGVIVVWGITGPIFHFSDTWQLIINTGTTIITFLMVFLIQNTQNRDMSAPHLKLDELIRVSEPARNNMLTLEDMTEDELDRLKATFALLAGNPTDSALPREAAAGLETAIDKIREAKDKIAAEAHRDA